MKLINHEYAKIVVSVVVTMAILAAAYFANGSEYEDAWLYIVATWIVILPLWDLYAKKKSLPSKKR